MIEKAGSHRFHLPLHGGEHRTGVQWYFREETRLPVAVQRWVLPPGGSEGAHVHPAGDDALEEMYMVIDGTAVMSVDDAEYTLDPGDAVLAPAGARHELVNPGPAPATVLVVRGPPGSPLDWSRYRTGRASREAAEGNAPCPTAPRSATSPAGTTGAPSSVEITISTVNASRLAAFWSEALAYRVLYHRDPYIVLGPTEGAGPRLVIQSITSPTPAGGFHLDLRVDAPEETVARLVEHGARVRRRVAEVGKEWIVMTDPDGNVFCVCPARTE